MGINIDQHFRKLRDDVRGLDLEVDCMLNQKKELLIPFQKAMSMISTPL